MIEGLEELKKIMSDILGSFIIENGEIVVQDMPEVLSENLDKLSKSIYFFTHAMKSTRPFERIIIDSRYLTSIVIPVNSRILVMLAEKTIYLPLFKLVSKSFVSRLPTLKSKSTALEINKICNLYDGLFGLVAKKLTIVYGPEAGQMFENKLTELQRYHPKLLANVDFRSDARPKISKIKLNAIKVTRDELLLGLDDLLMSMLETLKDTTGSTITDKAINLMIKDATIQDIVEIEKKIKKRI
jgi:hypothetical protein